MANIIVAPKSDPPLPPGAAFGWVDRPAEVRRAMAALPRPLFSTAGAGLRDTGVGKTVLLYTAVRAVTGGDIVLTQERGVCVSKGYAWAVDGVKCGQIASGASEIFTGRTCSEAIYGGCKVAIGNSPQDNPNDKEQDGAVGAWAAAYIARYGTLVRAVYGDWDVSAEDDSVAVRWAITGVPAGVESLERNHVIKTTSLVTSYEEARDALANEHPVVVCSNQGFRTKRDRDGFARPYSKWRHCMVFIAVDDASGRPGLLCQNSWGPEGCTGPKRLDQPEGSFWVDADVADHMLSGRGAGGPDSFVVSGYVGYPAARPHLMI